MFDPREEEIDPARFLKAVEGGKIEVVSGMLGPKEKRDTFLRCKPGTPIEWDSDYFTMNHEQLGWIKDYLAMNTRAHQAYVLEFERLTKYHSSFDFRFTGDMRTHPLDVVQRARLLGSGEIINIDSDEKSHAYICYVRRTGYPTSAEKITPGMVKRLQPVLNTLSVVDTNPMWGIDFVASVNRLRRNMDKLVLEGRSLH